MKALICPNCRKRIPIFGVHRPENCLAWIKFIKKLKAKQRGHLAVVKKDC